MQSVGQSSLKREVFSTLSAVQFSPQLWAWQLLTKSISDPNAGWETAMKSTRRTTSSRDGHLGGNHCSVSLWAGCVDSCDWAPIRNLQLLHDMGEPRSHPEAVFLWQSTRDNVSVQQILLLQKPTAVPGQTKHYQVAIPPLKGNTLLR